MNYYYKTIAIGYWRNIYERAVYRPALRFRIFTRPMHCGVLLEQSLMFIRRRDDEEDITVSKDLVQNNFALLFKTI